MLYKMILEYKINRFCVCIILNLYKYKINYKIMNTYGILFKYLYLTGMYKYYMLGWGCELYSECLILSQII